MLMLAAAALVVPAAVASDDDDGADNGWRVRVLPERSDQAAASACLRISSSFTSPIADGPFQGVRSGYEYRVNPFSGNEELHFGIDIRAPEGSAVRAIADGVVLVAGDHHAYSRFVIIRHGSGRDAMYSLSAHLQGYRVEAGQRVRQGERIGAVGETGNATNPHLHFELYRPGPLPHRDFDAVAAGGQSHHSPRGNIYYDPQLLFCSTDEVRRADPRIEWFVPTRAPVGARAAVHGDRVLTVSGGGTIHSVDESTGEEQWGAEAGAPVRSSPTVVGERLYVGTAGGTLLGLDLHTGEIVVEREFTDPIAGDVLHRADTLFVATTRRVFALGRDGEAKWSVPREEEAFLSVGTEAVITGRQLVTRDERSVVARSMADGSVSWRYESDAPVYGLDSKAGSVFAVSVDGAIAAIDSQSGRSLWRRDLGAETYADVTMIGDSVHVGSRDGYVRALSIVDGTERWRTHLGASVNAAAAEVGDHLVVGTDAGELIALDRENGRVVERIQLPDVSRILAEAVETPGPAGETRVLIGVEGRRLASGDGLYLLRFPER